jgi:cephalosporin-C deacetylase-like acetyl esterase
MIKAIDYLYSMPEFDGQNLIVQGGSQGGALTIVAAALDSRVKTAIAFYPALSDLTGYLHDRAGGWPHMFKNKTDNQKVLAEKVKSTGYYDVVNFARVLKTPIFVAFGYNDMVCPPTSSYSVYNIIKSDKTLLVVPEIEHFSYPEMWTEAWKWANDKCGLK